MVSPISDLALTASLRAAAATFISRPAIRLLSRLPISHAPSILYSSFTSSASIPARVTSNQSVNSSIRSAPPISNHDYLDGFSKRKGTKLPPRRTYHRKVELEDGATALSGPFTPSRGRAAGPLRVLRRKPRKPLNSPFAFAYSLHQEGQQVSAMNSTRLNPLFGAVFSGMSHGSPRTR